MRRPSEVDPLAPILPEDLPRGRTPSIKSTSLSNSGASTSQINADALLSQSFHSHHTLSITTETAAIPSDPILYLPPLLSPLPSGISLNHPGPSEQELSTFSTRLPHIDPASLGLHQALHRFHPLDDAYAAHAYDEAFNWSELNLAKDVEREWYCVVFRSRRKPDSASLSLYRADREAHEEAVHNGGLVMYWYGVPDSTGLNLATCIWQSRRHAVKAIMGPKHLMAMTEAKNAYEVYDLERWVLKKSKVENGLRLSKWQGGEVGW